MSSDSDTPAAPTRAPLRLALVVGALGVVFGDIGTSPLYTIQTVFNPDDPHPVAQSVDSIFGIASLIFWSVTIIVTIKYVGLVMRADNEGEGGIMALITLIRRGDDLNFDDDGIAHITARFGYSEQPDVPAALRLAVEAGLECPLQIEEASYFLSTIDLRLSDAPGMSRWRKCLFIATSHITADATEYFGLPRDRTVIMGSLIEV